MHRFFVNRENIQDSTVYIDKEEARHIEKVLRLKEGDKIIIFDGTGREYEARLIGREKPYLIAKIEVSYEINNEPPIKLHLVQGIAKGDKMDTIIQKAVEIGVSSIYPLVSERTVVRLEAEKADKKIDRWQQIAVEACKQCRRNIIPPIKPIINWADVFEEIAGRPAIMLYENEDKTGIKEVLKNNGDMFKEDIFLLVGSEGGFTSYEAAQAQNNGLFLAHLGSRILRTETAGIVGSGIVLYELGDLG